MANIALKTDERVEVVESIEQATLVAFEAITAGAPVRIDPTTGKFRNGNATTTTEGRIYGIATRTVPAGFPVTAIRQGVLDGYTLTGLDYDDDVYVSDTDARIADSAGTVGIPIGRVIPATGNLISADPHKLLLVNMPSVADLPSEALVQLEVSSFPQASPADHTFFVANRAYRVTAIREVHSTAGSDGSAVNVQVTKDTGTQAPGAGANLLTNNTNAGFDMKGTANTVQTGTLTATTADLELAAGDRLSLDFAGTLTALAGVVVTVSLEAI